MTRTAKTKTAVTQTQRMTVTTGLKELKRLNRRITARIADLKAVRTRHSRTDTNCG